MSTGHRVGMGTFSWGHPCGDGDILLGTAWWGWGRSVGDTPVGMRMFIWGQPRGDRDVLLGTSRWVWGCLVPGDVGGPPSGTSGCFGQRCRAQGAAPSASQWLCRAAEGLCSPRYGGAGRARPFPLTGAMKEALCARPLPWPVRPSGCGMKGLFRRASTLPAPGNRSRGGAARGRTHNAPLCRAPGAARQCPHPGVQPV